jgi:hypothetical protein
MHYIKGLIFFASLSVLSFFYGFYAIHFSLFPGPTIVKAHIQLQELFSDQVGTITNPPVYLNKETGVLLNNDQVSKHPMIIVSWMDGHNLIKLINNDGKLLHSWRFLATDVFENIANINAKPELRPVHGVHLHNNGDIVFNIEYSGTAKINSCSEVLWNLPNYNHHSISLDEKGNYWIPAKDMDENATEYPGIGQLESQDTLQNMSPTGSVIKDIRIYDILLKSKLKKYIFKIYPNVIDRHTTHLNDIEVLSNEMSNEYPSFEAGDLLISLRNLNLVFVMDPETFEIKWHISDPLNYQHDPDFIGKGWIGIYNNRTDGTDNGKVLGGSQIVGVHTETDETKILFEATYETPFYTEFFGKWQLLENGNMLLTESMPGRVIEVTKSGEVVWEWMNEKYHENAMPVVTEATRININKEEIAQWNCSKI